MAMVVPCSSSVEAYAAAGKAIEVPRPDCAICSAPMSFWSGYWRKVRDKGEFLSVWIRRVRCSACRVSHGLLPSFLLLGRYDPAEVIGSVVETVAGGAGVRPAASKAQVPHGTARDWVRRFAAKAGEIATCFSAAAVELAGVVPSVVGEARRDALLAIEAAYRGACELPGWAPLGRFGFCSAMSGGRLVGPNTNPLSIRVGKRRFISPVR